MTDLFNLVIAACNNPRRGFGDKSFRLKNQKKIIEREAKKARMSLLGSQKFYVCDSLMRHACEATVQHPKTMLNMMNAAIPPFANMWIEWDEQDRGDNMLAGTFSGSVSSDTGWEVIDHPIQMVSDTWDSHNRQLYAQSGLAQNHGRPHKIGLHIYACEYTAGAYYADMYFLIEGKIGCSPYSLRFTNGDNFGWSEIYNLRKNSVTDRTRADKYNKGKVLGRLNDMKGMLKHAESVDACVKIQLEEGPHLFGLETDYQSRTLDALYLKAGLIGTLSVGRCCLIADMQQKEQELANGPESWNDVMDIVYAESRGMGLMGWRGEIRWITAVLSLLNYSHTVIERDQEPSEAKRKVFGVPVPRNELRVVQIDLPKPRGTVQYEKLFTGSGAKKRRHVRRGHYRRYIHKDGTVTERWIAEQWVGDASLGTIIHDYELINKRNKG